MITRSGQADLPLHTGKVPPWLYERMARMARAIVEAVVADYGKSSFLSKISDPYWFQALGSVLGMDWHSSGITTSVMGALKQAVNPISKELGLYVCGGRGGYSRRTPDELMNYSDRTGLDGKALVRSSRLTAKVDNTAIQDGFQIYLHSFIISDTGEWSVVQQGMNGPIGMARRYHWHSPGVKSFVEDPHASIVGEYMGKILNLTDTNADGTADDKIVTTDDIFSGTVNTDDDTEALTYEFDKSFPEITKHAEAYEAEIEKLIENMNQDIETVLVEYRDI